MEAPIGEVDRIVTSWPSFPRTSHIRLHIRLFTVSTFTPKIPSLTRAKKMYASVTLRTHGKDTFCRLCMMPHKISMTTDVKAQVQDAHSKVFKSLKGLKQGSEQRARV